MAGVLDRAYAASPVWLQNLEVSGYGLYWRWLRFGPGYRRYLDDYLKRDRWSLQDWSAFQAAELKHILAMACEQVPYYSSQWNSAQKKAAMNGQLAELPLLEKDAVRADPRAFIRAGQKQRDFTYYTSGTTGTPISTIWTAAETRKSLAVREARSARWAGVSFALPRATFSGRIVEPNPDSLGPYYRFNWTERQAYLSPFHLKPASARLYVKALRDRHIQWLTGYAVSYYLLAKFILEEKLAVPPLRAVITTSEKLTPEMRVVMESAYRCQIFEEYSTVENVLFASECAHGRLHASPDVGLVEILRPDGSACLPGEVGEVVATCLMRDYQPMIRYRLGDLAAWDPDPCPCGRAMPVIKEVVGRIEDVVIGPDGRQMVRFHGIFAHQPHIREGQIVQEALDRITVKVVVAEGFGPADEQEIVNRIQQRLTSAVSVTVKIVPEIPRSSSGKYKAVVSNLKAPEQVIHE